MANDMNANEYGNLQERCPVSQYPHASRLTQGLEKRALRQLAQTDLRMGEQSVTLQFSLAQQIHYRTNVVGRSDRYRTFRLPIGKFCRRKVQFLSAPYPLLGGNA